jgi:hypothetical protein
MVSFLRFEAISTPWAPKKIESQICGDQVRPRKIEASNVRASAPHQPIKLIGRKGHMGRIAQHGAFALRQSRRFHHFDAGPLHLLGALAALGQANVTALYPCSTSRGRVRMRWWLSVPPTPRDSVTTRRRRSGSMGFKIRPSSST